MSENRWHYLLQQQLSQNITQAEQNELALLIAASDDLQLGNELTQVWNQYKATRTISPEKSRFILKQILPQTAMAEKNKRISISKWMAAAAVLLFAATTALLLNYRKPAKDALSKAAQPVSYTRHIQLPDGSTVVLHAGSSLNYTAADTRELSLSGEAWFDIAPNPQKPFNIHTGKLVIAVLGTSLNVKAYPKQKEVIVAVTTGKVEVKNNNNVLGRLTTNQQLVYNIDQAAATKQQVNAAAIVQDWTKKEMVFEGETLGTITEALARRYNVAFSFHNPKMQQCRLKISFAGTETLENVLHALAVIQNLSYETKGDEIMIDGKEC